MKKLFILFVLCAVFSTGCARTAIIRRFPATDGVIVPIEKPVERLVVGEKFTFRVTWNGIPAGTATSEVEELTKHKNYDVYKIVVKVRSNRFLSRIYKVDDTFISWTDRDKLISRAYEGIIKEGSYRKHLVVDYDFQKHIATYENLVDGSVKTYPMKDDVRDPLCATYYGRTLPVEVGDTLEIDVNLNEKDYEIIANIKKMALVTLPKLGDFKAFLVKPHVMFEGARQKKGRAWGYISACKDRLILYGVLRTRWFGKTAGTLREYYRPCT